MFEHFKFPVEEITLKKAFSKSSMVYVAIFILDTTYNPQTLTSNYFIKYNWKMTMRSKLGPGKALFYIEPLTQMEVKVFLDPVDLKLEDYLAKVYDDKNQYYLLYLTDSDAEGLFQFPELILNLKYYIFVLFQNLLSEIWIQGRI